MEDEPSLTVGSVFVDIHVYVYIYHGPDRYLCVVCSWLVDGIEKHEAAIKLPSEL